MSLPLERFGSDFLPEDDFDESTSERLLALGEMFPEPIRNGVGTLFSFTSSGVKTAVLFAPVIIQSGLIDIEEMAKAQQRQMLLGTNPAAYPR